MTEQKNKQASATKVKRGLSIEVIDVTKVVGEYRLLSGINISIHPGEFIGVLGPSGSGKSTLLKILLGTSKPTGGSIIVGGGPFSLGYVPQDDIVHTYLTPREAIEFSAHLRLSEVGAIEIGQKSQSLLKELAITERSETLIKSLSGGQRKRVNIGVELVTSPRGLLMDEPTSGLDPATEGEMMHYFKSLAGEGRTILVTTHILENIDLFDRLLILCRGRLVFDGTASQAKEFFQVERLTHLYQVLQQRPSARWEELFLDYKKKQSINAPSICKNAPYGSKTSLPAGFLSQILSLIYRYLLVTARDLRFLLILISQAPIIAIFIILAYDGSHQIGQIHIVFKLSLAAIWFGCINSCREIVKERAILNRELMAGLSPGAYLVSKFVVLSFLSLIQTAILSSMVLLIEDIPGNPVITGAVLFITAMCGTGLGLLVSAVVNNSDRALTALPIILMPQVIFVGVFTPLKGVARYAEDLMISKWSYETLSGEVWKKGLEQKPLVILISFAVFFFFLTYLALRKGNTGE